MSDAELENRVAEEIWLQYFNRYLLENGTVSEKEYKRMTEMIARRNPLEFFPDGRGKNYKTGFD